MKRILTICTRGTVTFSQLQPNYRVFSSFRRFATILDQEEDDWQIVEDDTYLGGFKKRQHPTTTTRTTTSTKAKTKESKQTDIASLIGENNDNKNARANAKLDENARNDSNLYQNKSHRISRPIKAFGEYIYGPNAIYSALLSNKRPFFHRLYIKPIDNENENENEQDGNDDVNNNNDANNDEQENNKNNNLNTKVQSKRKQRFQEIISLAEKMQIPVELWYVFRIAHIYKYVFIIYYRLKYATILNKDAINCIITVGDKFKCYNRDSKKFFFVPTILECDLYCNHIVCQK